MGSVIKIVGSESERPERQAMAAAFPSLEIPLWMPDEPEDAGADAGEEIPSEPADIAPDPEEMVRAIIAEAEERAREIVAAARAEAASIGEAARQAGFAEGRKEAEARLEDAVARLEEQGAAFRSECEAFFASAEPELARLSIDIARKVLKQELKQTPDAVLAVVRACMHRVKDKSARILVNPAELDTVRAARETFMGIADGVTELDIVSDRRVGQGGCVLETPGGNLDARLETQLAYIAEVFDKGTDDSREEA